MTTHGRPPLVRKQAVARQATAKQTVAKRAVAKKAVAKKAVRRPVAKSPGAQRAVATRAVAKKAVAKQATPAQARRAGATRARNGRAIPQQRGVSAKGQPPPGMGSARRAGPPRRPRTPPPPRRPLLPPARIGDPNRRLRMALSLAMVVLVIFSGRLVQLQGLNGPAVAATALASRQTSIPLPAHRGDILDSSGATLATTVERRNITVDQLVVRAFRQNDQTALPSDQGVSGAAPLLAGVLGMSVADVTGRITGDRRFSYITTGVEPDVWRQVARLGIPGVSSEQASRRIYPSGPVVSNVIGFLNSSGVPQGGTESAMQSVLKGRDGKLTYERGKNGQQIATGLSSETEPVAGRDVQLTINRDLQWKTQELLAAKVKETGAQSGQAVVMDPKTGAVLALVSVPTFDPNDPSTMTAAKYSNLQNRAVTFGFEPGSTSKVITAAAALEEGKATPSTRLKVDSTIRRGGKTFHDSHAHGPEKLTFAGVIAQSSNVGTIRIGEKVPATTMYQYLHRFGLGVKTGVGMGEISGTLAPVDQWNNSQRYTVLFGQGLSVTALQSASVFATVANNGVRVTPRLVQAVTGADGHLDPVPAAARTRVVSDGTARTLRTMLEHVVSDDGTGVEATVPGYRVAGKTGTAQAYDEGCRCYRGYTASFVGMAPADEPRLVVAVYLQKPVRSYYGGSSAAPVFQQVMTYGLARLGIEPTGTTPPKVPQTW